METRFKMKIGSDLEEDKRRAKILRQTMKPEHLLVSLTFLIFRIFKCMNNLSNETFLLFEYLITFRTERHSFDEFVHFK